MKKIVLCLFFTVLITTSCRTTGAPGKIEVVKLVETTQSWDGTPLPDYLQGNPKITVLRITIPPQSKLETHKHLEINAGVLLRGALTVISQNQDTLYLKAGDPIVELVDTWHYGENEGNEPAEIIVFYAGVEGVPITVLKED